jgi:ribonuclease HI
LAAAGIIDRNHDGKVIRSACCRLQDCRDAEEAEAKAALRGLELLEDQRDDKIALELDSVSVAKALRSTEQDLSRWCYTIDESKRMLGIAEMLDLRILTDVLTG